MVINFALAMHEANTIDADAFAARYPYPVLYCEPFQTEEEPQLSTSAGEPGQGGVPFLLAVRSRVDGAHGYGDRITLGRTGNNDIVIPASDISKIHGYFTLEEGGAAYTDAHSSYGSLVDGEAAVPGVALPLAPGARLELASVRATFLDAAALYTKLRAAPL